MHAKRLFVLFSLFAALAGAKAPQTGGTPSVVGRAVYYHDRMNGRNVAEKGQKYDNNALTAATHRTFPLGSTVRVTNLRNHKSVVVKVNDRMNPKSKSVIDLSRKAAETIDIIHAGHAQVRVQMIGRAPQVARRK